MASRIEDAHVIILERAFQGSPGEVQGLASAIVDWCGRLVLLPRFNLTSERSRKWFFRVETEVKRVLCFLCSVLEK